MNTHPWSSKPKNYFADGTQGNSDDFLLEEDAHDSDSLHRSELLDSYNTKNEDTFGGELEEMKAEFDLSRITKDFDKVRLRPKRHNYLEEEQPLDNYYQERPPNPSEHREQKSSLRVSVGVSNYPEYGTNDTDESRYGQYCVPLNDFQSSHNSQEEIVRTGRHEQVPLSDLPPNRSDMNQRSYSTQNIDRPHAVNTRGSIWRPGSQFSDYRYNTSALSSQNDLGCYPLNRPQKYLQSASDKGYPAYFSLINQHKQYMKFHGQDLYESQIKYQHEQYQHLLHRNAPYGTVGSTKNPHFAYNERVIVARSASPSFRGTNESRPTSDLNRESDRVSHRLQSLKSYLGGDPEEPYNEYIHKIYMSNRDDNLKAEGQRHLHNNVHISEGERNSNKIYNYLRRKSERSSSEMHDTRNYRDSSIRLNDNFDYLKGGGFSSNGYGFKNESRFADQVKSNSRDEYEGFNTHNTKCRQSSKLEGMSDCGRRNNLQDVKENRYRRLMSLKEQEYIARIQIGQLVSSKPYRDDYYYKLFMLSDGIDPQLEKVDHESNSRMNGQNWQQRILLAGHNYSNEMPVMMYKHIQNIISRSSFKKNRKVKAAKPQESVLENTLGDRVTKPSFKNPRKLILINMNTITKENLSAEPEASPKLASAETTNTPGIVEGLDYRNVLILVEKIYGIVLEIEVSEFHMHEFNKKSKFGEKTSSLDSERDYSMQKVSGLASISAYQLAPPDTDIEKLINDLEDLLELQTKPTESHQHIVTGILNTRKGMRVLPRLILILDDKKSSQLIGILMRQIGFMNVFNNKASQRDIDAFMLWAILPIISVIMQAPISDVTLYTETLISKWKPTTPLKNSPGLTILTILLSRAENFKQLSSKPLSEGLDEDLEKWDLIYERLFSLSKSWIKEICVPESEMNNMPLNRRVECESCAWKYLTALSVGSLRARDQQEIFDLVKDRIMNTIDNQENEEILSNVNLFLGGMGISISDFKQSFK